MAALCEPSFIRRIDANRTVKDALEAGIRNRGTRQRVSVTDLVNPMQAYHSRTHPEVTIPLDRLQLMWTGTGFHRLFGAAVSTEEFLEQFVERDGVVGKIDIFEDFPIELKTSASLPEDLLAQRPAYVDQLAMYCYMAERRAGAVVVYRREEFGRDPALMAYRVAFHDLEKIGARMRERRDLFLDALARHDPSRLERCEWFGRRCDYESVCSCASAPPLRRIVDAEDALVSEDQAMADELKEAARSWRQRPTWAITLNDLVFPRRGVLFRTVGRTDDDDDNLADLQHGGFFSALTEAIRYSEPGAYKGTSISFETVRGVVRTHRAVPTVIRSTNTREMIERDRLPFERGYWIDRLALESALVGSDVGRLVVYYPRLGAGDKFMVYDLGLSGREHTLAEARRRLALFEARAGPSEFPPCGPAWMSRYCPYKDACACQ